MDYKLGVHISVNTMRAYYFIIRYDEDGTTWLTWLGEAPPGHPHGKETPDEIQDRQGRRNHHAAAPLRR